MVAVLDQREHDVIAREPGRQLDSVLPRHVWVLHPLQDADRAAGLDHGAKKKVVAAVLDQAAGNEVGLAGVCGRAGVGALLHDRALHFGGKTFPHQLLGEIHGRGDQDEPGHPGRCRCRALHQFAHEQQRQPAAHGGADHYLRTTAEGVEHRQAFLQPAADGALGEDAAGFPMSGIIEAGHGAALFCRPSEQGLRLGSPHVGLEAAEPKQAGRGAGPRAHCDRAGVGPRSNVQEFQGTIGHWCLSVQRL